ncbi:MAG: hypothetical protein RLZZ618_2520 [Pseudomonadota bacterium]|jgi:Mg2+ and Co2+ transporter CorA
MKRTEFNWKLPREISDRLGTETYGAQRAIHERDHLLLVTHEPPQSESNERRHAVFLRLPGGQWLHQGNPQGERVLADLLEQYGNQLAKLEITYSAAQTAHDLFTVMDLLLPLTRAATNLRDTLQSARDMVKDDKLLIDMRDRAVDVARGLELLLANARAGLDYRLAQNAEEQTQAAMNGMRAQNKLNVIAALTFPLMTLAAVFGMNLRHGLEGLPSWGFWAVFAGGVVLGLMVRGWVQPSVVPARPALPKKGSLQSKGNGKGKSTR